MKLSHKIIGFALIFSLYIALIMAIWWELEKVNEAIIEEQSTLSAQSYANLLASFRSLYTSEVVDRLDRNLVRVSHDYHQYDGAIPLPATLTIKLAEITKQTDQRIKIALNSDFPFPWRKDRVNDPFISQALAQIKADPNRPVVDIEKTEQGVYLRYAKADIMNYACVACHNSHPDSPKRDWRVGDVRGVLSVTVPMSRSLGASNNALRDLLLIVILIGSAAVAINGYLLLAPVIHPSSTGDEED